MKIHITKDHPHFAGHFPNAPVLPGVSQIGIVVNHLRELDAKAYRVKAIRRGKFRAVMKPDTHVHLEIQRPRERVVRWTLRDDATVYSMGEVEFYEDAAPLS